MASADDAAFLSAIEAVRVGDRERLASLAPRLASHPLASYIEFWRVQAQLRSEEPTRVRTAVNAFAARHPNTYLADRLRLEWLLSLGARRDFESFEAELPALVNNDDAQLRCYSMLSRYLRAAERNAAALEARQLLSATRDSGGEGCWALTEALLADSRVSPWERMRALVEQSQFGTAKRLVAWLPKVDADQVARAIDKPAVWLAAHERRLNEVQRELALVAIARLARDDPEEAARYAGSLNLHLTPAQRGIVWGRIGHMAALRLLPDAADWYRRGGQYVGVGADAARADEILEWQVRAALRASVPAPVASTASSRQPQYQPDWAMVRDTIERMSSEQRRDPTWVYWYARALAADGREAEAQELYRGIANRFSFYGKLAAEELGQQIVIPQRAAAPTAEQVAAFADNAGLQRALKFYELGMRLEGNREWNWQIRSGNQGRGMDDQQLLALAEFARQRGTLDRMIASSERTRAEFDFAQRFPSPHRQQLTQHAKAVGLDETWVYGLIRQESRFIADVRSSAGAQGLMQLMPATARYVARRVGMNDFSPARINEIDVNLRLGTSYLRMVLDDLDGHPILATAAYNAGPGRPRQWRSTLQRPVEGAIFAETIPFNETRDYVKKVMSNSVYYAALFENRAQSLKQRLGTIAPKAAGTTELP